MVTPERRLELRHECEMRLETAKNTLAYNDLLWLQDLLDTLSDGAPAHWACKDCANVDNSPTYCGDCAKEHIECSVDSWDIDVAWND